jgi:putative Mn2+ efflux pump MntP
VDGDSNIATACPDGTGLLVLTAKRKGVVRARPTWIGSSIAYEYRAGSAPSTIRMVPANQGPADTDPAGEEAELGWPVIGGVESYPSHNGTVPVTAPSGSVSTSGQAVDFQTGSGSTAEIWTINQGYPDPLMILAGAEPALSPDGLGLALVATDWQIHIRNIITKVDRETGVLRLIAFVLPLGLDSFAVAAALGALRPSRAERWRVTAVFATFEAGMPLIGVGIGAPIARLIAGYADYLAAAALVGVGLWMLLSGDDDTEENRIRRLVTARGAAVIGLGVGISLDELAIGFSLGLTRLSITHVVAAIAVQAIVAVQLGLLLGARVGERLREGIERLAAIGLILVGGALVIDHLT